MIISHIDIDDFLEFLYKAAETKRENAALSGSLRDDGAGELEKQIDVFKAGLQKAFPDLWEKYIKKYNLTNNSEYQTYLKLKEKFE